MIHWQSFKEAKIAESSAEAELYALSSGHKVGRNFRLLVCESLADDILLNLRCDNQATIAMLDNPTWRTRYLSTYGGNYPPRGAKSRQSYLHMSAQRNNLLMR